MNAKFLSKLIFKLKNNEDVVCFIAGGIMGAAAIYASWKGSPKFKEIKAELDADLKEQEAIIEKHKKAGTLEEVYPEKVQKRDRKKLWIVAGGKMILVILPIAGFGLGSLSLFARGYGVLRSWYSGMAAAYVGKCRELKFIKEQILAEEGGEEKWKNLTHPTQTVVDENGESQEVPIVMANYDELSKYFAPNNPNFSNIKSHNRIFLDQVKRQAQRQLERDGFLYLNDVYKMLDLPQTDAGQLFGWILYKDEIEAKKNGASNLISFGPYQDEYSDAGLLLMFNVCEQAIIGRTWCAKS